MTNERTLPSEFGNRPRKVLHVLNSAAGGAALSTLGLIEQFRAQGIAACAVCHDAGSPEECERLREATDGETLFTPLYWWNRKIRIPAWKRPLSELKQLIRTGWTHRSSGQVANFAMAHGADLIHTNTLTTPEGGIAARRLGLPHVWHIRELVGPCATHPTPFQGRRLGQYLAAHCSKLIANSDVTASYVRSCVPDDLLEVVPNGIELSHFEIRRGPAQPDRLVVAMIGNPTARWKKHALFIEAASRVDRGIAIEWRIYGHDPSQGGRLLGNPYVDQLHARIAEAGLADRFAWPGFVSDPAEIMSQIDLLVHPADAESFGRIVVEAMAAGLPTIGVRGGGVAEIIDSGVTGLLAEPDDPIGLATAIEQLVRDPARRQAMGAAGRRRAGQRYSLAACATGVMRVYESALQRPVGKSFSQVAAAHGITDRRV
ncbi:MAG: glycosyltransferase family 4 protein [Pirellulales bacterium]